VLHELELALDVAVQAGEDETALLAVVAKRNASSMRGP
jgi:hypothetical protein